MYRSVIDQFRYIKIQPKTSCQTFSTSIWQLTNIMYVRTI